jgi:hypothetical protein
LTSTPDVCPNKIGKFCKPSILEEPLLILSFIAHAVAGYIDQDIIDPVTKTL